jgi:hypothetical protein
VINIDDTVLADIAFISSYQYWYNEQSEHLEFSQTNDTQLTVGFVYIGFTLYSRKPLGRFSRSNFRKGKVTSFNVRCLSVSTTHAQFD